MDDLDGPDGGIVEGRRSTPVRAVEEGLPPGQAENRVSLTYLAPPDDLKALFGPLYRFIAARKDIADHTRADFAQLRFMLQGEGEYIFADGRRVITPATCLLGPTNGATHFEVDGPMHVLGVSILPLGWAALGVPDASTMADDVLDLAAHFGDAWQQMLVDLRAIDDVEAAAEKLWDFLRPRVRPVSPAERTFVDAVDAWLADERSPRVTVLEEETGLSARQVARLCNRFYGAPPKFLSRKYRALRCALILALEHRDWQEVADGAFYDQSHFIREFRHFIGLTPSQLRDNASLVMRLTMMRRDVPGEFARLSRIS